MSLLAGRASVAMAMYEVLSENAAQYAALYAAADAALPTDDARLFRITLKKIKKLGADRNILAHGIVANSSAVSDGIIIVEQKHLMIINRVLFHPPRQDESRQDQVRRNLKEFSKHAFIFRRSDFEEILQKVDHASSLALALSELVMPAHHNYTGAKINLLKDPEIESEMRK